MLQTRSLQMLAGSLLLLTGVSHMAQLLLYGHSRIVLMAAFFGLIYAVLGTFVLRGSRAAPWIAAAACSFGLFMGTTRLLTGPFNPQIALHQLLHLLIIPSCITIAIRQLRRSP